MLVRIAALCASLSFANGAAAGEWGNSTPIPDGWQLEAAITGPSGFSPSFTAGYDFGPSELLLSLQVAATSTPMGITQPDGSVRPGADVYLTGSLSPGYRIYLSRLTPGAISPFVQVDLDLTVGEDTQTGSPTTLDPAIGTDLALGFEYVVTRHLGIGLALFVDYEHDFGVPGQGSTGGQGTLGGLGGLGFAPNPTDSLNLGGAVSVHLHF